jgi:hypothetical protein
MVKPIISLKDDISPYQAPSFSFVEKARLVELIASLSKFYRLFQTSTHVG